MASAPRGGEADGRRQLASLEVEASPISVAVNETAAAPEVVVAAKGADEAPAAAMPAKVAKKNAKKKKPVVRVATKSGDETPQAQPAVLTVPAAAP
jgi:hypothetical protein